jgi:integrase
MKPRKVTHHGKEQWMVERTLKGKRKRKFFSSESKAKNWIRKEVNKEITIGREHAQIATSEWIRQAVDLEKKLQPYEATLELAVKEYIERVEADGKAITLGELRTRYFASKEKEGLRPLTIKEIKAKSLVFQDALGPEIKITAITPVRIDQWLDSIAGGAQTKNHYRRIAHAMMEHAVRFYSLPNNPVSRTAKRKVDRDLPGIFTSAQMKTMLTASKENSELQTYLALGAYAGLRATEVERLDWQDISLKTGTITLRPEVTKARKKRLVAIRPVLKKILQKHEQLGGPIVGPSFSTSSRFGEFKKALKFKWPHNGLRHSFGTYHLAAFRNAGETAIQMGHRGSPSMLLEHYDRGDISEKDALKWWGESTPKKTTSKKSARQ